MRRTALLPASVALAVLVVGGGVVVGPVGQAGAAFPGENGRIAFSSDRDGDFDIYTVRPDGSGLRQLTDAPGSDSRPEWSPDGTKIAFDSDRDGDYDVYVKDLATGEVSQLTNDDDPSIPAAFEADQSPAFSPDGTRIAFSSNRDTWEAEAYTERIFVTKADGSEPETRLTEGYSYYQSDISWSPDGVRLLFERGHEADYTLATMNADGSDQRELFPLLPDPDERYPDWSPSGEKVVFTKGIDSELKMDVWKMDPDGSDQKQLTNTPGHERAPDWAPGGGRIAFERNGDLFWMRASDGSNRTNITATPGHSELDPDWRALPQQSGS